MNKKIGSRVTMKVTTIEREFIERIRIVGPYVAGKEALRHCFAEGYRVIRSGPLELNDHKVDDTRFLIVAEREHACLTMMPQ